MASEERRGAPIDRVKKLLNEQFERFKKTPYTIPVAIGVTVLLQYLMLVYMPGSCLLGLLPPLILFGLLWQFDIKRVRKMLVIGLVTATLVMGVGTAYLVSWFQDLDVTEAASPGIDPILRNGTVDPLSGGENTAFTYSLTVVRPNENVTVANVSVLITALGVTRNGTMVPIDYNETSLVNHYIYTTQLNDPINQFRFGALVNDTWVEASDYDVNGDPFDIAGPIFSDPLAVAIPIIKYVTLYQAYLQFFAIYAILCGMVWWIRRARRMREQAIERWEQRRKEIEAKEPEDDSKKVQVPSLSKAMGLEDDEGGEEGFVCSECGADVPGEARSCPVCGEKFD